MSVLLPQPICLLVSQTTNSKDFVSTNQEMMMMWCLVFVIGNYLLVTKAFKIECWPMRVYSVFGAIRKGKVLSSLRNIVSHFM